MKGAEAERAAQAIMLARGYKVDRAMASNFRFGAGGYVRSNSNDRFAVWDLVCLHPERGDLAFLQVTTTSGVGERKRKIVAAGPWPTHVSHAVFAIWEARKERNRTNPRTMDHYFRVHRLEGPQTAPVWRVDAAVPVEG